jgi:hypothetical protein
MPAECECSPEHSVTKLGHSRDCGYYDVHRVVFDRMAARSIVTSCGTDVCHDGSPHDFNWATYDDAEMSTGVCRCGLRELDLMLLRGHP